LCKFSVEICHRGNTAKLKAAAAPGRDRGGGERGKGSRRNRLPVRE